MIEFVESRQAGLPPHTRGCTHPEGVPLQAGGSFPRTRGDVPHALQACRPPRRLPPHTRGCTLPVHAIRPWQPASPAHAGMYRSLMRAPCVPSGFPRTRGDVPCMGDARLGQQALPPHTRGCTFHAITIGGYLNASPAHAGMYRAPGAALHRQRGFPRTRGDVPYAWRLRRAPNLLPPHTRGCTRGRGFPRRSATASPAHAGMYRLGAGGDRARRGFPRTRGDVPLRGALLGSLRALPPHTRGCTQPQRAQIEAGPASPAHAGMYRCPPGCGPA